MKLLPTLLLTLLTSCGEWRTSMNKYDLGQKVMLKTGDAAVITRVWHNGTWGINPPPCSYTVRVSYTKRVTEGILDTRHTDVGTFVVEEFEIEGLVK